MCHSERSPHERTHAHHTCKVLRGDELSSNLACKCSTYHVGCDHRKHVIFALKPTPRMQTHVCGQTQARVQHKHAEGKVVCIAFRAQTRTIPLAYVCANDADRQHDMRSRCARSAGVRPRTRPLWWWRRGKVKCSRTSRMYARVGVDSSVCDSCACSWALGRSQCWFVDMRVRLCAGVRRASLATHCSGMLLASSASSLPSSATVTTSSRFVAAPMS